MIFRWFVAVSSEIICAWRNRSRADLIQARKAHFSPLFPPVIMTRLDGKRILETERLALEVEDKVAAMSFF